MNETQNRTVVSEFDTEYFERIGEIVHRVNMATNGAINAKGLTREQLDELPVDEGMGRMLLAALADAGYVVVEREQWVRVRDAAEEMGQRITERGWGEQYTRPGDLGPMTTQEGE